MAAADTTATFSCPVRGGATGDYDLLVQWAITSPTLYETPILIAAGNNAISPGIVGSTIYLLVIVPPASASTDTWHLKGVNGDTGVTIATPGVQIISGVQLSPGLVLNATTGGYTIVTRWLASA